MKNRLIRKFVRGISRALLGFIILVIIVLAGVGAYGAYSLTQRHESKAYQLVFIQSGACTPRDFNSVWWVVLNNKTTQTEPPNATSTLNDYFAPQYKVYQNMTFSATEGTYTYSVGGIVTSIPATNAYGVVTVTDSNTSVTITNLATCTTTSNLTR